MAEFMDLLINLMHLLVNGVCAVLCAMLVKRSGEKGFFRLLTGMFACVALGDFFWTLHIWIIGWYPEDFSVSDFSYVSSYCFLIMLFVDRFEVEGLSIRGLSRGTRVAASLSAALVIVLHFVYYWVAGGFLLNLLYGIPMAVYAFQAVALVRDGGKRLRAFYWMVLLLEGSMLMMFFVSSLGFNPLYDFFHACAVACTGAVLYAARKGMVAQDVH